MFNKHLFFFAITIFMAVMLSCSTGTQVTGSWTRIDHKPEKYNKIVVLGIGAVSENRRLFEDEVETRLAARGYPVLPALDMLPPNAAIGTITKEIVMEIFSSEKVDAVFTMSVRHMEDTRRYVPARGVYYTPYYYNVGFYDYYSGFSNYYYTPGYYTGSVQIFLEANFFDFETGELLWSAQTKTVDVSDIQKMAVQFADVIVEDFIRQNVVPAPAAK
jgi:hypothetical protein